MSYPNSNAVHPLASLSRPAASSSLPASRSILNPTPATTHSPESIASPHAAGSGEGGAPIGGRVTSGSTKRARGGGQGQSTGGNSDDEDAEGKKKRNRQALSCGECKRRKIKCDRKIPCIACIKRNSPHLCSWEDAKIEPEPQVFALSTDLRRLASRLSQVETFLQTLPPELSAGAPQPQPLVGGGVRYYGGCGGGDVEGEGEEERSKVDGMSDTEEAAVNLEATAFGGQAYGSGHFRPVDSLPFFDTKAPKTPRTYRSELTKEFTSIIAPAINTEAGLSCSVQLGLDFGVPVEEVEAARRAAVAKVLVVLPDKETSIYLVSKYFEDFDWIHHTIYKKSFDAELERYWEMMEEGRGTDVDPLWLALYSMVLALSIDGLRSTPAPAPNLPGGATPDEAPAAQALKWFAAAQRFLTLGDWQGAPQARSIMTVILLGQYIQISSFGGQANRFLGWLSSAVRIAQLMGLHQLGDDPKTMPPEDPCWPPGPNSVKREGALRIFGVLLFLDWLAATTRFPTYMLHPSQFNSPPLSNLNDADLSPTDWRSSPLPRNMVTDASFEFCKYTIALQSRKVFDKLVSESATFSYATVLELDRGYRHVLDQVPDIWKTEHSSQEAKSPRLRWKRHVVQESIHSRIVRLHRPFLTRGYNPNSRYRYSTEQCVASAKIVIATHHNILDVTNNVWFLYNHALGAAIVLFCDLFHAIDNDFPEVVIENKKETLVTAFEIFGRHSQINSPILRAVVQQGSRILGGLFMAEEKRRVTRAARTLVGNEGGQSGNIESFAQVLQRISNSIDVTSHAPVSCPNSTGPHLFAHTTQKDTSSSLDVLNYEAYNDNALPYVGDVNFDHLNSMFFQDLGVAPAAQPGFNLWSHTTPSSNGATGLTPPDEFAFLGTGVDWENLGVGHPPLDANALAATALLGQMGFSY